MGGTGSQLNFDPDNTLQALLEKVYHQARYDFDGDGSAETKPSPFSLVSVHGYNSQFTSGSAARYVDIKWANSPTSSITAFPVWWAKVGIPVEIVDLVCPLQ
ncbi:MAG: hypothetical protein R3B47_05705 [Bacteroidia bacterium]